MSSSTRAEQLEGLIAQYYPVGKVESLTPLQFPPIGDISSAVDGRIWQVGTDKGQYCLKDCSARDDAGLDFEYRFRNEMHKHDFDLFPKTIATKEGKPFAACENRKWWLEKFLPSQHHKWWRPDLNDELCRNASRALAEFHLTGAELGEAMFAQAEPPLGSRAFEKIQNSVSRAKERLLVSSKSEQPFAGKRESLARSVHYAEVAWLCIEAVELLEHSRLLLENALAKADRADLCLIHGDFHPGNILVSGTTVQAIVDLEYLRREYWMFDYAYGELMFCTQWNLEPDGTDRIEHDLRTAFAQGYLELDTGKLQGWSALAPFRLMACMVVASWLLDFVADEAAMKCLKHVLSAWSETLGASRS